MADDFVPELKKSALRFALLLFYFLACFSGNSSAHEMQISGKVRDGNSNDPFSGVSFARNKDNKDVVIRELADRYKGRIHFDPKNAAN